MAVLPSDSVEVDIILSAAARFGGDDGASGTNSHASEDTSIVEVVRFVGSLGLTHEGNSLGQHLFELRI